MLWRVNPSSPAPLFEQVAASVRRAIADGGLQPKERLPSAKEVAAALGINMHTVLRAYQLLRDEGLIELRKGRGAVGPPPATPAVASTPRDPHSHGRRRLFLRRFSPGRLDDP